MRRRLSLMAAVILLLAAASATAATGTPVFAALPADALPGAKPVPGPSLGQVKPSTIPLGHHLSFCRIHWVSWGKRLAIGTGTGFSLSPTTYKRLPAPVVIVLSNLGTWNGHRAYRTYYWYIPTIKPGHPSVKPCKG